MTVTNASPIIQIINKGSIDYLIATWLSNGDGSGGFIKFDLPASSLPNSMLGRELWIENTFVHSTNAVTDLCGINLYDGGVNELLTKTPVLSTHYRAITGGPLSLALITDDNTSIYMFDHLRTPWFFKPCRIGRWGSNASNIYPITIAITPNTNAKTYRATIRLIIV